MTTVLALSTTTLTDIGLCALLGLGSTLVLADRPWFRRQSDIVRLGPYLPSNRTSVVARRSQMGMKETIGPTLDWLGTRLNQAMGIVTDLPLRLQRAGVATDPYDFRLRQMASGVLALLVSAVIWIVTPISTILGITILIAGPMVVVLAMEQWLNHRIEERSERLRTELPVMMEQLGMLVSAGFSLTSAIAHIATRGSGVVADDFRAITREVRRGVPPDECFDTWARTSGLPVVEKVVGVLALNSEASDLGSLISAEARSIRASAHRDLLEAIEKRSQLVWIPVTVATLVPGLIFLAVPFYAAMAKVTGG